MASRVLTFEGPGILATDLWYWVAYANLCWKLNLRCTREERPGHPKRAIYRSINPTPSRPCPLRTCWPWIWQELNLRESDLSQKHFSPQAHLLEYYKVSPNQLTPSPVTYARESNFRNSFCSFLGSFPNLDRSIKDEIWLSRSMRNFDLKVEGSPPGLRKNKSSHQIGKFQSRQS